jgi:hypothetical protein
VTIFDTVTPEAWRRALDAGHAAALTLGLSHDDADTLARGTVALLRQVRDGMGDDDVPHGLEEQLVPDGLPAESALPVFDAVLDVLATWLSPEDATRTT